MALAVCVLFDPVGDRAVRQLWARLEAHGIPTLVSHTHGLHRPHLSYAVLRRWDLDRVLTALAALPAGGPFPITVQGTVFFPRGRAALAAAVNAGVVARQEAVVGAAVAAGADLHHHSAPGHWVPHISASTRAHGTQQAVTSSAINDILPLTLVASAAAVVDSGTGAAWPLPFIP